MQRPAELDLALDVDDLAAAEPDLRGDAARLAKGEPAKADHRQPVDLADLLAVGLDADRLAADLLLEAPVDAVAAAELRVDRRLHLKFANDRLAGIAGELVGFVQQVVEGTHARRYFVGIAGEARRLLNHPPNAGAVERPQLLAP